MTTERCNGDRSIRRLLEPSGPVRGGRTAGRANGVYRPLRSCPWGSCPDPSQGWDGGSVSLAPGVDPTTLAYAQNPAWDSVAHMQLIGALESEFDIMLETDDVIGMSNFQEAERIVRKYGVA